MATSASIQLIRNATLLLQYAGQRILVDPMFSPKGTIDSFAGRERNPTVDLPMPIEDIIKEVDLVLVTHTHPDHFDPIASEVLNKSIKIFNQPIDAAFFQKAGFTNAEAVNGHIVWNGINIYRTGGQHGSGAILERMGAVSGFVLKAPNEPTVYIVGDSIWVDEVEQAIEQFQPDVIVVNSGGAAFPGFESTPILMTEEQVITVLNTCGDAKVIAVHMDALDHCRTTRDSLKQAIAAANFEKERLIIPQDGEVVAL